MSILKIKNYNLDSYRIVLNREILLVTIYCIICGIYLKTFNGDSAIFLNKFAILASLKNQSLFQYQGLIEYLLMSFSWNGLSRIITVKTLIIFLNLMIFKYAFFKDKKISIIEIILHFTVIQFYLAPSAYSYAVSGFSMAYLSALQKDFNKSLIYFILFIIFCGTDLPNPKYIGLGFIFYLFIILFNNKIRSIFNNLKIYIANLIIFLLAVLFLLNFYKNNINLVPDNYELLNNSILLDLVNREYLSAIIPYKKYRYNTFTYILFLYFIFYYNILYYTNYVKEWKTPIFLFVILLYVSFGILDPLGITTFIISKFPQFSFLRTRAGFDLLFYMVMLSLYVKNTITTPNIILLRKYIFYIVFLMYIIQIPQLYKDANSLDLLIKQGQYLDFIDSNMALENKNICALSVSNSYEDSDYFGFGPPLYKLSTNAIPINVNSFEALKDAILINNCNYILFNNNFVNKVFISNLLYGYDTVDFKSYFPFIFMGVNK